MIATVRDTNTRVTFDHNAPRCTAAGIALYYVVLSSGDPLVRSYVKAEDLGISVMTAMFGGDHVEILLDFAYVSEDGTIRVPYVGRRGQLGTADAAALPDGTANQCRGWALMRREAVIAETGEVVWVNPNEATVVDGDGMVTVTNIDSPENTREARLSELDAGSSSHVVNACWLVLAELDDVLPEGFDPSYVERQASWVAAV